MIYMIWSPPKVDYYIGCSTRGLQARGSEHWRDVHQNKKRILACHEVFRADLNAWVLTPIVVFLFVCFFYENCVFCVGEI